MAATLPPNFLPKTVHDPDATVVPVGRLVADAGTGVATRLLASHDGGKVLLVALDDGETLPEHAVPFAALIVPLAGAAEFTLGGATVRVGAGEALRLTPREAHAVRAVGAVRLLIVLHRA